MNGDQMDRRSTKILIVDDDDDLRQAIAMILAGEGFEVDEAEHGEVALQKLRANGHFDVVLLDLFMPIMDGWQTLEVMRETPQLADVPVFVCTSAPDRAPPGVPVLKKPFDLERLLETIGEATEGGH
jgi:CheY-like chemotaxis protein